MDPLAPFDSRFYRFVIPTLVAKRRALSKGARGTVAAAALPDNEGR
jgi:hypothetical protein